jgi:hypothetical protein
VVLSDSITNIGNDEFDFCSLTNVFIPGSVVYVGSNAFYGCTSLTNVSIADGVAGLGEGAFDYCAFSSISFPASVTNLANDVFNNCRRLVAISVDSNNPAYMSQAGILFNKDQTVLLLYPSGLAGSYVIPNNVANIGYHAFLGSLGLSNVVIGTNIAGIGSGAFSGSGLANVAIPASVTNLGSGPFADCLNLKAITVDTNNPAFVSVNGVLFNRGQTMLIQFPSAISGSYIMPGSVDCIGDSAFESCLLTNINPSANLQNIGSSAFDGCSFLTSISIPNSVTNIGDYAFANCFDLTNCVLGGGVTSIGNYAFESCTRLRAIVIPEAVINVGNAAFSGCTNLWSITLGNSVTNLGDYAFSGCAVANLTIPQSVISVGNEAFFDCFGLSGIYFKGNSPAYRYGAFTLDQSGAQHTIYYLPGSAGWGSAYGGIPTQLWAPQVQRDARFGVRTNQFGFNITAASDLTLVVQACTNLLNSVWQPLQTVTLTNGSAYFSDLQWTNYRARFYRLSSP